MSGRARAGTAALLGIALLFAGVGPAAAQGDPGPTLDQRLEAVAAGLDRARDAASAGNVAEAQRIATRTYLDDYEPIESLYGSRGPYGRPPLGGRVDAAEADFHALMGADAADVDRLADALLGEVDRIRTAAGRAGVATDRPPAAGALAESGAAGTTEIPAVEARTPEIRSVMRELDAAEAAYEAGDRSTAIARVEHAYLEGFEPIEPRLSADLVSRAERRIHLDLRPRLAHGSSVDEVRASFAELDRTLLEADRSLAGGGSFWFSAASSFAIVVREGLEAVLLIAAILAYLARVTDDRRHERQVWAGVGLGVVASLATWVVARTVLPVSGGSRELIEGLTSLAAVGVLLYVSNWLFQKTYIHDWKEYLRSRVGVAVTTGSALAMAGLAFAAVYREGFETVLFYQALLFDAGAAAVLAGFLPGLLLISAIGFGIIRFGLRLPLKRFFGVTNGLLLYLAFVFLGKGLYNLQEAGLFAPHPVGWVPDHEALRQLLGLYPIAESLLAQAGFLALVAGTYVWYRRRIATRATAVRSEPARPEAAARP